MTDRGFLTSDSIDAPREHLRDAGVTDDAIRDFEARVETTVDAMQETYSEYVDLDTSEQADAVVAIQDELLAHIVATGQRDAERGMSEWFDRIDGDFTDPESTSARSGVGVVLGSLSGREDAPRACRKLANAAMTRNYDQASGGTGRS